MSLSSFISDLYSSIAVSDVQAEAPPADEPEEEVEATEEKEEEEEEEDEPLDPLPAILEECEKTKECHPAKHHYDECAERVTAAADDADAQGPKEDCVEEFFHLMHCTTHCAAPKLFAQLK